MATKTEVHRFHFAFNNSERVQISPFSTERQYNLEDILWVISVESVRNNQYGITYGILDSNTTEWYNSLIGYPTTRSGTGNLGGRYYGSETVECYLYLGAMIDEIDFNKGVVTSGQWSVSASKQDAYKQWMGNISIYLLQVCKNMRRKTIAMVVVIISSIYSNKAVLGF